MATKRRKRTAPKTRTIYRTRKPAKRRTRRRRGLSAGGQKAALEIAMKAALGGAAVVALAGFVMPKINPKGNKMINGAVTLGAAYLVATKMKQPYVAAGMVGIYGGLVLGNMLPLAPALQEGSNNMLAQNSSYQHDNNMLAEAIYPTYATY